MNVFCMFVCLSSSYAIQTPTPRYSSKEENACGWAHQQQAIRVNSKQTG